MAPRDIKPSTRFVDSPNLVDPVWYSNAVSVSGEKRLVLTSGQTGQLKDGSWPGTFAGQVKQAVTNLVHALNAAGVSAREIIKITFYPVDWSLELGQDLMTPVLKLLADDYGVENRPLTTLVPVAKLAHPESKFEIEAVAVAGGSADHWTNDSGVQEHVLSPTEMDVVVVGGGFSGLAAAYRCQEAGLRAMLLEAKHRVGGRSRTQERSSGPGVIELGATWINKTTQPEAYALTQMFGLETVTQYTDGDAVFQRPDGTIVRGAEAEMENGPTEDDRLQEKVLTEALLARPNALNIRKWDDFPRDEDITFAEWVAKQGCTGEYVQAWANFLTIAIVGRESNVVGAHYFLDYVKSGMGYISLMTEGEMGAQSLKIKKGTSAIASGLANTLRPGCVLLNSPVDSIVQYGGHCQVTTTSGRKFKARKVIMANPTNTYADIRFAPPLPQAKKALVAHTMPGKYAKMVMSFREPWWRKIGLVGKFTSLKGPICFSWDTSDPGSEQYSLAFFIAGQVSQDWHELSSLAQEVAVLKHLAQLVGPEHAHLTQDVIEINTMEWTKESFIGGAPTCSMGPRQLSQYGVELRKPFNDVHFAGGETAFEWKGYLEGAISAGYRAAEEVTSMLQPAAKI